MLSGFDINFEYKSTPHWRGMKTREKNTQNDENLHNPPKFFFSFSFTEQEGNESHENLFSTFGYIKISSA